MLLAEYDGSSPFKNFTDRLNLRKLQIDDIVISQVYCRKYKKLYEQGKSDFK